MEAVSLNYLVAIIFIVIFFIACNKRESNEGYFLSNAELDTLTLSKSFKGWELYSWQAKQNWNYSLLTGTNNTKFCSEIRENKIIVTGTDNLKILLSKLPEGEYVTWIGKEMCSSCDSCKEISLPQKDVQEEIKDFCESKNLHFYINQN